MFMVGPRWVALGDREREPAGGGAARIPEGSRRRPAARL